MIRESTREILKYVSGERAFQTVAELSTFHRIQASQGFRDAANHCKDRMERMGIASEVLSYPAKEKVFFGTYPSFQEWKIRNAWCDLVSPAELRLADFDACAISIIQRSAPIDLRKKPADLVMLNKGTKEAAYRGIDLKGKVVFCRGDINDIYDWAIEKGGAVGIITDYVLTDPGVRERHDQSDTRRYTAFNWKPGMKKAFGFVITPRLGDKLEAACIEAAKKKEYPKVSCYVDSELFDGAVENVSAFIPGKTDEEILITAHLCHPRACANDNASGCAAAMEAMRTIKDLVETGKLPPLKRGIRMLLIPEFTGTYAWLDSLKGKTRKYRAGFNMDMVGGRQREGYGPLCITDLPLSEPSFVGDAAAVVLDEIKHEVRAMGSNTFNPMFNSQINSYMEGSDHSVLSDPAVDIPTLMLGQWPDRYYHTSTDTLDQIDPYILSRSAALGAAYAYALANLEEKDMGDVFEMGLSRTAEYLREIKTLIDRGLFDGKYYRGRVALYTSWRLASIDSWRTWVEGDIDERLEAEKKRLRDEVKAIAGFDPATTRVKSLITKRQSEKYGLVIKRTMPLPAKLFFASYRNYPKKTGEKIKAFQEKYKKKLNMDSMSCLDYYFDGKRATAEVAQLLAYEFGVYAPDAVDDFARILLDLKYAVRVR